MVIRIDNETSYISARLRTLRALLRATALPKTISTDELPLRSELFSADQMEQHGKTLANWHQLSTSPVPDQLLARLAKNESVLTDTCDLLTKTVKENKPVTPAGEWLLDNFYLIEEQIRTAKRHLPKGYSRELPRLANGQSAGLPRVYDIALETISHGDGRVDTESLSRFVAAYQTVSPLKLGELWAIPIMLRLALIENLRRVAARMTTQKVDRDLANAWADQMMDIVESDPKSLILVIADMARSNPPMVNSFVAELARRLQGQSAALALPLTWVEQRLSETGLTIEQLVQIDAQQQAANQVSISNSIGSLRLLAAIDWQTFVEQNSLVEQILCEDPAGVYAGMTFATRDYYRHVIERLARKTKLSEGDVAWQAIKLSADNATQFGKTDRKSHVGFYLIDKGLPRLEQVAAVRHHTVKYCGRFCKRFPVLIYVSAITFLTVALSIGLFVATKGSSLPDWLAVLYGITLFFGTSQLAVALVNWLSSLFSTPQVLPKLDLAEGILPEFRTLVVVPTLLINQHNIESLAEALEVRFLANRDENLRFALLTDLKDAREETVPTDGPLLQLMQQKIEELNDKYRNGSGDIFFLFHRPRRWNARDQIWMGYERKRGKLADLNAYLRNATGAEECFSLIVGDREALGDIRYVITLDTDTLLPRDAARQLVGAIAHPLNRPVYNEKKDLVCDGYAILQPRVGVSLSRTNTSAYSQLYGSDPGIDPYTRTVSNVYQDLFHEGSFIGKGIYDVDAFEQSLSGRFPENHILSHDLLEGCYARAGLLSDVQLYEEYPSTYQADVNRRHRWIRGDWQILDWLFPTVPGLISRRIHNPLSLLSRWKIFDNIRRSLVPFSLLFLLIFGWTVLSPSWLLTMAVLAILFVPLIAASLADVFRKPDELPLIAHLNVIARSTATNSAQVLFTLSCLPYEACYSMDAVLRTIWRRLVSHKGLLAWNVSHDPDRKESTDLAASYLTMAASPAIAIATTVYLFQGRALTLVIALPILLLWLVSPAIAWWASRSLVVHESKLSPEQTIFLRKLARKTWAFFEILVGADDNWLPPDNYQEQPTNVVAHRTSPTNMGLSLLANLSAYDFGYISCGRLINRLSKSLATMRLLERHRGHFYNWYDTQTLKPLLPIYISTVDSGNLSGHLLTLRPGLLQLISRPILQPAWLDGIRDTLLVLSSIANGENETKLAQFKKELDAAYTINRITLSSARATLTKLINSASELTLVFDDLAGSETAWWSDSLKDQCVNLLDELTVLAPWAASPVFQRIEHPQITDLIPTLQQLAELEAEIATANIPDSLRQLVIAGSRCAQDRIAEIENLAALSSELAQAEYDFLFDKSRRLLTIGYNLAERRLDASYYDLLASEARLCNFLAIALGQLPQESWFALGRLLTSAGGEPILFSWSGSMFEYLMPLLVMPTYENTLLDQTCKAAVQRQIEYGKQRGVPWGISESGYNTVDVQLNYQYRAFGVPGIGLKRGLAEDLVIAPYASVMALMVAPEEACQNLQEMDKLGFMGKLGFYEAVDYTPSRVPRGQNHALVQSFMAHHQGMSFLSLAYLLLDKPMQKLFASDPAFQATMLLLQERIPKSTTFHSQAAEISGLNTQSSDQQMPMRVFTSPFTAAPEIQLLSNGRYHVMMTNSGGGYSRWKDIAVTRWREDSTRDSWGTFCYIRDVHSGEFWSAAYQPTLKPADFYEAIFSEARVEYRRRDYDYDTHCEVVVSSEDDIELRRVKIINRSRVRRTIDITSYAEVVLTPPIAEAVHPAFSNLFVQTEIIEPRQAILCTRRPRSDDENTPWMFHLMAVHGAQVDQISYETDRMLFLGRGNSTAQPSAMINPGKLSGSQGSVLDPIVAIRYQITLEPEEFATINIVSGMSDTREACLSLVEKYQDRSLADRVFDLSWTHSQVILRQINANEADAQLYSRLASSVIFPNPTLRANNSILVKNHRGQSGLWGYAISGDLPIVLLQIEDRENFDLVRQLVQAHAYWRLKGLTVDLVIWNEDHAGYRQLLQDQILGLIAAGIEAHTVDRPGGIFVRPAEQIAAEDRILLQSVARAIIRDRRGSLSEQLSRRSLRDTRVPRLAQTRPHRLPPASVCELPWRELILFNGLGGFTPDGREYVITLPPGQTTPAPWINVLANPHFGAIVTENGLSYTWSENAHEYRLTPWDNDPVTDSSGEAFYIRDEESGTFWSPTPAPSRGMTPYVARHGFGYSVFEHTEEGITSELCVYVDKDAPIKFSVLKLRNHSGRARKLSATGYVEWVLGDLRSKSAMHIVTEIDPKTGALFARNPYNTEFSGRIAFFDVDESNRTVSGDRSEFIGRNGTLAHPAVMGNARLSGKVGPALDPCAAIQVPFELADGQEREIVFRLGTGRDPAEASSLVSRFRGANSRRESYETMCQYWKHTLGAVNVDTPDPSLNMLVNGWLLYQTIASRLWGRSGYYQSGGAFGFRDQLQDVMALIHTEPRLTREHILRAASRQFLEGDVQHWWHPPSGRGVRTHCSDDFLWLPLATCRYVLSTGDTGILDESIHFLHGRPVNPEDDSYYDLPGRSDETASLYDHCVRAILRGFTAGVHGLPLIGSCDWNDGMNLVGKDGKGESVWLGFFLYDVLRQFIVIAKMRGDTDFVQRCERESARLRNNLEANAWDGEWYRRAYFDDGTPLGTATNTECRIDSIAQSWSVLSEAGDAQRVQTAMNSMDKHLVRRDHNLIQLLDPPFDKSDLNPGYIKGYVPGVRENGGQYTHGAIWAAMAFAKLGDSKRAWELLNMINPINHANSPETIATYKVEPYVMAADVYAVSPHTGRGGWSWYTGSSSWMYRLIVESLFGLRLEVDKLHFAPCLPESWSSFKVHYRFRETVYHITFLKTGSNRVTVSVDGQERNESYLQLVDDRLEHTVEVRL
ncbi:MAG: hypothetical protein K2W82_12660 [Candidatus Obscuribacterales bacterium]|nr:hypothetical protein [Candidatus Obscuribacterales bacterium]